MLARSLLTKRASAVRRLSPTQVGVPEHPASTVLIIARAPMIGALMLSLVELAGQTAVSPRADEPPLAAITRFRPRVVLLDCEHDIAHGDALFARARAVGAAVLLYSPARTRDELERLAAERGVRSLALPVRPREFISALGDALGDERIVPSDDASRRAELADTTPASSGTPGRHGEEKPDTPADQSLA